MPLISSPITADKRSAASRGLAEPAAFLAANISSMRAASSVAKRT